MTSEWLHVAHVKGLVKKWIDVDLGPKTLILGPTGSGKSAITGAVELALTGGVSDVAGRAVIRSATELRELGSPSEAPWAEATLSDGSVARWQAGKGAHILPDGLRADALLPLRTVRETQIASAAAARAFFLRHVAGDIDADRIRDELPELLHPLFLSVWPRTVDGVDALLEALEAAKKRVREARAEARGAERTASDVAQGAAPPNPADLAAAEAALRELEARATASARAAGRAEIEQREVARQQGLARAWEAQRAKLQAAVEEAASDVEDAAEDFDPFVEQLGHLADFLDAAAADARDVVRDECFACGASGPISAGVLRERATFIREQIVMPAAAAQHRRNRLQLARRALDAHDRTKPIERLPTARSNVEVADNAQAAGVGEALADARLRIVELRELATAWDLARRAHDSAFRAAREIESWTALVAELDRLVAVHLTQGVATFEARVQGALPEGDQFAVQLDGKGAAACRVGLRGSDVIRTALSGFEGARVAAAIAAAIAQPPLAVVIPDDRPADPSALARALHAFGTLPVQVIVATPIEPESLNGDWTVVTTG